MVGQVKPLLHMLYYAAMAVAALLVALWINEKFFMEGENPLRDDALRSGINALELYPYTGFHIQANYHHTGPLPEKQPYDDYDIQSGDLGFFDFKLDEDYPKQKDEFRIILIGGSGAQGWGARTNADMMYRLIPKYLNEKLAPCDIRVTLFNLAMASSKTYQNFIALNLWGHRLNPDMILSYSGRNDANVPFNELNDAWFAFNPLNAYVLARRAPGDEPGLFAWLSRHFPRTMEHTQLGTALRLLFHYRDYLSLATTRYPTLVHKGAAQAQHQSKARYFEEHIVRADYSEALKSIKRDFAGIPIALAWQPVTDREWRDTGITKWLGEDFYTRWFDSLPAELGSYMNREWYFYDADSFMKQHPEANTGTHEGNAGQELISRYLAEKLAPVVASLKKSSCVIKAP